MLDAYSASKRVRAVFVGHDHVNGSTGDQKGVSDEKPEWNVTQQEA